MPDFVVQHLQPGLVKEASWPVKEQDIEKPIRDAMISGEISGALEKDLYRPIAVVRCASVDDVFPITNHIDHDWTTNEEVIKSQERMRSTSVGDIAVDCEAGTAWACRSIGWSEIGDARLLAYLIRTSERYLSGDNSPSASLH